MPAFHYLKIVYFLLFLAISAQAQQKYLALDKPGRVKRIRFYAGDDIRFKLKNDKIVYEEVIGRITDSTIELSGTAVPLRDIRAIIVRREGGLAEQAVHKLPVAGVLYFLAATFNPVFRGEPLELNRSGVIVGSIFVASGQFFRIFLKRTYRINSYRRLTVLENY